jgi:hypothetical protein
LGGAGVGNPGAFIGIAERDPEARRGDQLQCLIDSCSAYVKTAFCDVQARAYESILLLKVSVRSEHAFHGVTLGVFDQAHPGVELA